MPATNPLLAETDGAGGYAPGIESLIAQNPMPGALAGDIGMNQTGGAAATQVNAAGTSENVAVHVAAMVVLAGVGVIGLRKLGFRFAVAGNVGFGG